MIIAESTGSDNWKKMEIKEIYEKLKNNNDKNTTATIKMMIRRSVTSKENTQVKIDTF